MSTRPEPVTAGPLLDRALRAFDRAGPAGRAAGLGLGLLCIVAATVAVIGGAVTALRLVGRASQWLFDNVGFVQDHPRGAPLAIVLAIATAVLTVSFFVRSRRARQRA